MAVNLIFVKMTKIKKIQDSFTGKTHGLSFYKIIREIMPVIRKIITIFAHDILFSPRKEKEIRVSFVSANVRISLCKNHC